MRQIRKKPSTESKRTIGGLLILCTLTIYALPSLLPAQVSDSIELAVTREPTAEPTTSSPWGFGLGVGIRMSLHSSDFSTLPRVPSCSPGFDGGVSFSPDGSLLIGYRLNEKSTIELLLGYSGAGVRMEASEVQRVFNRTEGTDATFRHELDASIGSLTIAPRFHYNLTRAFSVAAGPHIRLLTGGSLLQSERIVEPAGILFENDRRTRSGWDGELPGMKRLGLGLGFGLSYEIEFEGLRPVRPAVDFGFDWTPTGLVENVDWQAHSMRLGVRFLWSPQPKPVVPSPLDPVPTEEDDRMKPRGS